MVINETYVMSSMVKVDITIDERYYCKMRFYLLDQHKMHDALECCNSMLQHSDKLAHFIPDFIDYVNDLCNNFDKANGTSNSFCPYEQIVELGVDIGALEYPVSRIKEIGYIEEQFVLFDINNNMNRLSPLTLLYSVGVALTRKAMEWPLSWSPNYV